MPSPTDRPYTRAEIDRWTGQRRPHEREPVPQPGERLLLREVPFGEAVPAVVADVQDMSSPHDHWNRHGGLEAARGPGQPDVNVWAWDEEHRSWRLRDDPWPWVQVQVIAQDSRGNDLRGPGGELMLGAPRWCREARVRGSAGWLREGSRAHTGRYEETGE
jgi:hypothetical protein